MHKEIRLTKVDINFFADVNLFRQNAQRKKKKPL